MKNKALSEIKMIGIAGMLWLTIASATAQELTTLSLDSCYTMARRNYPLVKQYALIERSKEYSIDNASKGYLPQFVVAGQASYQSAVTQIPISVPGITIPTLSKDQYKLYGEISEPITDLFFVKDQKQLQEANAVMEEQKIEVELYKLRDRINQLFFGILLMEEQLHQTELLKKDIQSGIDKTNAAIANGISFRSSADMLKAEMLKTNQRMIEVKASLKGYIDMLSLFIYASISENTKWITPDQLTVSSELSRPEMKLYDVQKKMVDIQSRILNTRTLPKFSLFFQGGVGRPALNLLNNNFSGYYIGGLRLNWNISSFYTNNKEREILHLNQNTIEIQRETFLFNTNINLKQQNAEMEKLQALMTTDNEIIALRENVKNASRSQLENGTATTNDYLTNLNAEDQARQNLLLHHIQFLLAQYNYQNTTGN
jgi:outer membrane protein TolC